MKKLVDVFSRLFEKKGNQNFQERLEAIDKDELYQITEVQKVIKFMKQESTRSFVAPKPKAINVAPKKLGLIIGSGDLAVYCMEKLAFLGT